MNTLQADQVEVLAVDAIDATCQQSKARWHVLAATWLGELFDGMDASIYVLTLYPALSELLKTQVHSTIAPVGALIVAIFIIGQTIGGIVFGMLADYIGRARTMMITILLYAVCTGLCAFSHSWLELAFYRFLVGCGIGGEICIGAVLVSEYWRGSSRLYAAGILASSWGCGYLVAAVLNLWLGHWGWRWLFLIGVIPALVTVYIRRHVKEPEQFVRLQTVKKALKAKRCSQLTFDEQRLISFTFPRLFGSPYWSKTLVAFGLTMPAIVGYWAALAWIPAWINQLVGSSAINERSTVAIVMNLGAIFSTLFTGALVSKIGRKRAFMLAYAGALFFCLALFGTVKEYGIIFLTLSFALGAFANLPLGLLFIYVPELFEASIRSTGVSFSMNVGRIFAAMAAVAGGQLIGLLGGSYPVAGITVGMIYIVGLIVSLGIPANSDYANSGC